MTRSVAILGCGPSGLMVAHAANISGWDFRIYSKKQESKLYGAQYLHAFIPGLDCGEQHTVEYLLEGTAEQYRRKVYGEVWDGTVSPEDFMESHYAWDLRAAYQDLWHMYESWIEPTALNSKWTEVFGKQKKVIDDDGICHIVEYPDLVISTIPRTVWDDDNSHFERIAIWALGDTEMPRVEPPYRPDAFTVMCDGRPATPWYRVSNIFGYCTVEWPQWWNTPFASVTPPVPGASLVAKPLRYTGSAAQQFIHLGRYAQWQKGVLTSDVFFDAMKVFNDAK
jgi:hypothetical protein